MRHFFEFTIYSVALFIGLLIQVEASTDVQYTGLIHEPHFSPNGRHNAVIVEDRYPNGSEFSLMLWTMEENGYDMLSTYCLTPRYDEFVATPDGKIAFVAFDTTFHYGIHLYDPEKIEMELSLQYSNNKITQLQFSKDSRSFCYFQDFNAHPFASLREKIAGTIGPEGWIVQKNRKNTLTKSGNIVFSKEEKDALLEWDPIEKPTVLPKLFTQPMPKITIETQIQWSSDSKYIYVLDETGIWRLKLDRIFFPQWTKVVEFPSITRFHLSQTGLELLFEAIPNAGSEQKADFVIKAGKYNLPDPYGLAREIWLVDLKKINVEVKEHIDLELTIAGGPIWLLDATTSLSPRKITKGWGATFNPIGKSINYNSFEGGKVLNLDTMEVLAIQPTGYKY